jgi:hypothetical protein
MSFNPNNISFSCKNKVNAEVMGSRLKRSVCGCDVGETHENRSVCATDISISKSLPRGWSSRLYSD